MTGKEWLLLLLPIVINLLVDGVLVFILQKFIADKYIKRRILKDEIVKTFLQKLKDLNQCLIEVNFGSMRGDAMDKHVLSIQEMVVDLCEYFHPNIYDLKKFEDKFNKFNDTWMNFQNTWISYVKEEFLTEGKRLDLGAKMQTFYDNLTAFIKYVRKKY